MKVSELEGALLDYWVGQAQEIGTLRTNDHGTQVLDTRHGFGGGVWAPYSPSTDWAVGGPVIERERIQIWHRDEDGLDNVWHATCPMLRGYESTEDGPTPLVAAMRCYVAAKLGDEVGEVPAAHRAPLRMMG